MSKLSCLFKCSHRIFHPYLRHTRKDDMRTFVTMVTYHTQMVIKYGTRNIKQASCIEGMGQISEYHAEMWAAVCRPSCVNNIRADCQIVHGNKRDDIVSKNKYRKSHKMYNYNWFCFSKALDCPNTSDIHMIMKIKHTIDWYQTHTK